MTATRKIAPTNRGWVPRSLSGRPIRGFHRSLMYAAMVVVVSTIAAGCTDSDAGQMRRPSTGGDGVIVVGVSGAFAENQIVAEMYAQVLEDAGYTVERRLDLRSREVSQNALEAGAIDVKPEYLSSLLLFLDPNAEASADAAAVARQTAQLLRSRGLTLLTPSPAEDTNQFVANAETAQRFDLTTVSSLASVADQLTFGGPPECPQRPLCLPGLHEVYGIIFDDFTPLDAGGPADRRRAQERRGADRVAVLHGPEHRTERVRPTR